VPLPPALDLARAERLLSELIRAPSGVEEALRRAGGGQGLLAAQLRATVSGDGERPAELRLGVYANAYFYRLLDCLREDYGALAQALGEGFFHDAIALYLLACPPRHPSIRYAGDRLAGFLGEHASAAPLRERFPWSADLAALEWALQSAFDARDAEPLRGEDVAGRPPEQWAAIELRADPSLQLLELRWPLVGLRRAFERDQPLATGELRPAPEAVLVWRLREQPAYRRLEPDEAAALRRVAAGTRFGEVCECAADLVGPENAPGQAAQWLARWLADGCLQRP
jgi:hypothetical protein